MILTIIQGMICYSPLCMYSIDASSGHKYVASSVVGVSVCFCVCWPHAELYQKRVNRSICRLGADTGGPKEPRNRFGQDLTSPFVAATGDKSAMRPFSKLLWILVITVTVTVNADIIVTTSPKRCTGSAQKVTR